MRRAGRISPGRIALLGIGLLLLAAIWFGPLPDLAKDWFSAHMTMHMGVVAVVAPLLSLGIADTRLDLAARYPRLMAPIPLAFIELVIVWGWHAPALHHFARHSAAGIVLEQGTFLLSGLLVWLSAVGGARDGHRLGAGLAALLLTSMHMTLLGALLALAPRPLYLHEATGGSFTALDDQHLGGAIMLLVGGVSYLCGGLWLGVGLLRGRESTAAEDST